MILISRFCSSAVCPTQISPSSPVAMAKIIDIFGGSIQCGALKRYKLVYKPHEYIYIYINTIVISTMNNSHCSYFHQLNAIIKGGPALYESIMSPTFSVTELRAEMKRSTTYGPWSESHYEVRSIATPKH